MEDLAQRQGGHPSRSELLRAALSGVLQAPGAITGPGLYATPNPGPRTKRPKKNKPGERCGMGLSRTLGDLESASGLRFRAPVRI